MPGASLHLTTADAVVFVDETGHDRFHDRKHPVFGWAGCAVAAPMYGPIAEAWRAMKRAHFPGVGVLHAAELRKPTEEQLTAIASFFREQAFSRFGAVVRSDASLEFEVLNTLAAVTAKRLEAVLSFLPFSRVALVFEAGEAWTAKVNRMFGPVRLRDDNREIPVDKYFLPKHVAEPGLEIADFIAHAVGGAARTKNIQRKDFQAIFDGPQERSSFMLVESARRAP